MSGANCSIFGCGTSKRHKGTSIFKLPSVEDKENAEWRSKLLGQILKDKVADENVKQRIASGNVYVCEKHFIQECIETCKYEFEVKIVYLPCAI